MIYYPYIALGVFLLSIIIGVTKAVMDEDKSIDIISDILCVVLISMAIGLAWPLVLFVIFIYLIAKAGKWLVYRY
jgi:hypothetical protein